MHMNLNVHSMDYIHNLQQEILISRYHVLSFLSGEIIIHKRINNSMRWQDMSSDDAPISDSNSPWADDANKVISLHLMLFRWSSQSL